MGVTYPGTQVTGNEYMSGRLVICTEGSLHVNGPLRISPGAGAGLVATSDADGNVSWKSAAGDVITPVAVKTAAYLAHAGELVPVNTTAGPVTVTLPTTPANATIIAVKQIATAAGNATTVASGGADVFNVHAGAQTLTLDLLNHGVLLEYNAAAGIWYVISDDEPLSQLDLRYLSLAGGSLTGGLTAESVSASGMTGAVQATRYAGGTGGGAPIAGNFAMGDFVIDQTGALWICTAAGNPGIWVSVTGTFLPLTGGQLTGQLTAVSVTASGATGALDVTRYVGGTASGAPTGGPWAKGDWAIAQDGALWICTAAGTPGNWVTAAVAAAGVALLAGATFTGDVAAPTVTASMPGAVAASRYAGATASGAPVSGTFANGDFVIDQTGKIWICTDGATRTFTQAGTGTYLPLAGGSIIGGSLGIGTAGQGLIVSEGTDGKQGVATLGTDDPPVPGQVTVANTSVTANSRIFLTVQAPATAPGITGSPYVASRIPGTSFTIGSTNTAVDGTADTSVVAYEIFEPWTA
jgi:hypothetical protein